MLRQSLDAQTVVYRQAGNDHQSASFEIDIAISELDVARAALARTGEDAPQDASWSFPIKSPISGRVLRVFHKSSTIVNAGERILEVGDPKDLEIKVDVLSTDAVRIRPGARVILEQGGGAQSLDGRVRLVEPSAFTKVSALGIEEQRVNVIIDFHDPPESRPTLGDGYRVEAAIVEWESSDVLTVPTGALFREGESWAVFVVRDNKAQLTPIKLGHRNDDMAQILEGLSEGDRVILYPGDRVTVGISVIERSDEQ
jgi:HlyD family secretion protein